MDKLIPPNSTATDSSEFDITLICILIRNCTTLPPPVNGWDDKNPPPHDQSLAAFVIRAREWRNFVQHTEPKNITQAIFQQKWAEGANIIQNLGFQYDTNNLQTISLDPQHKTVLKPLFDYLNNQQNLLKQQQNLTSQVAAANTKAIVTLTQQHTKDITGMKNQQNLTTEEISALREQRAIFFVCFLGRKCNAELFSQVFTAINYVQTNILKDHTTVEN